MSKNVFDLAQEDTGLERVARQTTKGNGPEYAGPCPRCKSTDSFHVQPDRREGGAWMCRRCWPAEQKGWGDGVEYLRQMRGMSFTAAKRYLADETDSLLERIDNVKTYLTSAPTGRTEPPTNEKWQSWVRRYVEQAVARLWLPEGKQGLDYLHGRGLTDAAIKAAQLGYIEEKGIPSIVIPWHSENGLYWRVNKRDMRPDVPPKERYKNITGSSNVGVYGSELLKRKYPTMVVEGEIDALSIAQECGDLPINVIATGGLACSRVPKWLGKLARMPGVLVAYDREERGEQAAQAWLKILENAIRWRPLLPCKDANEMLTKGYSIRTWVEAALAYLSEGKKDEATTLIAEPPAEPIDLLEQGVFECSVCHVDLNDEDQDGYLDENMVAYCAIHWQALQQSRSGAFSTQEQFLAHVQQIATRLESSTGMSWYVQLLPDTYTIHDRVKELQEQERRAERDRWQSGRKVKAS